MKKYQKTVIGLIVLGIIACSSDTEVGNGKPLSSLSPQPTGVELASAFRQASYGNAAAALKKAMIHARIQQEFSASNLLTSSSGHIDTSGKQDCPGGGTLPWSITQDVAGDVSTYHFQGDPSDCKITIFLNGKEYTETLNGSITSEIKFNQDLSMYDVHDEVSLSASGSLGLAMDCDVSAATASGSSSNATFSGNCTFQDSKGKKIVATAKELGSLLD